MTLRPAVGRKVREMEKDMQENKNNVRKLHLHRSWVSVGICVSLIISILFTCCYGILRSGAQSHIESSVETESSINFLYRNTYLLYRDLYNMKNQTNADFVEIYMKPAAGNEWILEDDILSMVESGDFEIMEKFSINENDLYTVSNTMAYLKNFFDNLEANFSEMNYIFNYAVEDLETDEKLTNLPETEFSLEEQYFFLSFIFDEYGNVSIGNDVRGENVTQICKYATEAMRYSSLQTLIANEIGYSNNDIEHLFTVDMPSNCRITFCISNASWQQMLKDTTSSYYFGNFGVIQSSSYTAYVNAGTGFFCLILFFVVFAAGLFLPLAGEYKPWREGKICRLPFEILACLGAILIGLISPIIYMVVGVSTGNAMQTLGDLLGISISAGGGAVFTYAVIYFGNILILWAYFFMVWYLGICARNVKELKIIGYIKEYSIIYRVFPATKRKILDVYDAISHFDVTKSSKRMILKIVLTNAVILFIISTLWLRGFWVTIIYSVILYFVLKKYISDIQKKYGILLRAINEVAQGNLNVNITEDIGVFEPFKPQVIRIQTGFRKAVDEEVKSQRMKAELITNVSHDLKTPLTAIITYINLLKDENITPEQRKEYLDTLERKSTRLKVLIEDLFEVSKANTHNVTLNIMNVDIVNLIKQVTVEMSDKLQNSNLEMRMELPEDKVTLPLDSQKTYRIYENLLGNIAKYAMPGTRVYVNGYADENNVVITFKNITAEEITVSAEELTDRFVRGDASRNTEGSGLGLAIAKSFTELQGGELQIELDGDLFKVTTYWNIAKMTQMAKASEEFKG